MLKNNKPGASSASEPLKRGDGRSTQQAAVKPAWTIAVNINSARRRRSARIAKAAIPASVGVRTRARISTSIPECSTPIRIDMTELATNVENHYAHHEHSDKYVEKHA